MKPLKSIGAQVIFIIGLMFTGWVSEASPSTIFVGSTPGGELIQSSFNIPASATIDFIRWKLVLDDAPGKTVFALTIRFGESKPNTLGFKEEQQRSFEGTYTILPNASKTTGGVVYHLKAGALGREILLLQLNENLLHLLTPGHQLMIGNGGWSFTLNREAPVAHAAGSVIAAGSWNDTSPAGGFLTAEHPASNLYKHINSRSRRIVLK